MTREIDQDGDKNQIWLHFFGHVSFSSNDSPKTEFRVEIESLTGAETAESSVLFAARALLSEPAGEQVLNRLCARALKA